MHFEREIQENLNVFKTIGRSRKNFACAHDFGYGTNERMSCFRLILVGNKRENIDTVMIYCNQQSKTDINGVWTPIEQQQLYNNMNKNKNVGSFSILHDIEISS